MGGEARPQNLVQTIKRVSQILDILGQGPHGMSIREVSARIKLPKATTHRLLNSLSFFGYVRQDPKTRNYFLGFKLVDLGQLLLDQLDLRREAEPYLRGLAERSGETVHLVFLDRDEIVYIDKVETDHQPGGLRMASRVGLRNPVHSCAVGKVLLSYLTDTEIDTLIKDKGLPRRTSQTITNPRQLKDQLAVIKKQGYAIDDEENEVGIRCIAAPIFDDKGKAISAVSLSGPAFRVTKELIQDTLKKEVIESALEISKRLGFKAGH
jgi:IclR family KDG regulon transcriptional repressor